MAATTPALVITVPGVMVRDTVCVCVCVCVVLMWVWESVCVCVGGMGWESESGLAVTKRILREQSCFRSTCLAPDPENLSFHTGLLCSLLQALERAGPGACRPWSVQALERAGPGACRPWSVQAHTPSQGPPAL